MYVRKTKLNKKSEKIKYFKVLYSLVFYVFSMVCGKYI